jgi:hypothetical protein
MANLIQIKRSDTTATPTLLANGELAWSGNSDVLFVGDFAGGVTPIAGKRYPGTLTANQALVANSTSGIDKIIVANAVVTTVTANGTTGTAGQLLTSNGTVSYWADPANSSFTIAGDSGSDTFSTGQTLTFASANGLTTAVTDNQVAFSVDTGSTLTVNTTGIHVNSANLVIATSQLSGDVALGTNTSGNYVATITAGNGISGSSTTEGGTPTIAVVANSGLASNSSGVHVVAGSGGGLVSNSTGVFVTAGDGLVANATGVHVVAANGINVAADNVGVTTGSTLTVNTSGIHVNNSLSITDLSLSGNLTVSGTLTTIDTTNLTIEDPMIKVANGNAADIVDVGLYGMFTNGGTRYTGLFRDATDGIYKLFTGLEVEPTTTVNTAAVGYGTAILEAYLNSGALVSNSSNMNITANSIINVSISANTYKWSDLSTGGIIVGNSTNGFTNLALGTDGYVLQSNGTTLVYSTLDGGTF